MHINVLSIIVASLVTLLTGFIWYNPKIFGTIWMLEAGITEEKMKKGNMIKIFSLTLFYSFLLSFIIAPAVNHEIGAMQAAGGNANDAALIDFLKIHHGRFLSFKHGALHGSMLGIFFALPIIAINSLFEQKSWKYIAINAGYWILSLGIMGAIICGWQ
ncbi:DUF1761 domain-containing protein [Flavobacterium oreochromis]|uniref:DUF1761 domain-containing protein n=2 Tax=Flavobacterium TaxID=237 RepID=A0A246GCZ1_9FLAO|nr:DUF1761 domain-containing protein [Flavobacterium oreochromis]OWP74896.1 hypothetical protein BWG23_12615 [Flavobacterium oreochromis]OWP79145.1 hypothetical protein BWK62_03250 [Flavobacterium oreochromis]QYS86724.1 DUF1761 domain-containing protein [Flavobacterium oreochromis]